MNKKKIRIVFTIVIVICIGLFISQCYKYKIKKAEVSKKAIEILKQINYVKIDSNINVFDIRELQRQLDLITLNLKKVDILKVYIGDRPNFYKSRQDIIAVLNDGTEVAIFLYTGDWSFSIETIKGWHFRTDIWLEPVTLN